MSNNYEQLKSKLKEIFQLDQADLDFGIYRIMNTKRDEITKYLDEQLKPQVKEILSSLESGSVKDDLEKAIAASEAAGISPEDSPKVQELRKKIAASADLDALEKEIFSDLYNFFSRYYEGGDFLSLRRYKAGVYAIPYEGEEVKLHWANNDQYYIKTSEYFTNYAFRLPKSGKRAHFRLTKAETEQNNNKAANGKERRFMLSEESPVSLENGELIIGIEYKPDTEGRKQDEITFATIEALQSNSQLAGFEELFGTEKVNDKDVVTLEKHLKSYTARNSFDYFIHKDLGTFMRRELDFFLKNEVLILDDVIDNDDDSFKKRLAKLRALKEIASKIISFIAQLEDFQKKLWLKKKFVVETQWCITLDRVPEEFYTEIAANDAQHDEWVKLFAIDEIKGDLTGGVDYCNPLTKDFLKANPYLVLDTSFFTEEFKQRLVAEIDDLDEQTDGLLIEGDNFHALNLLQEKNKNSLKTIFIDPPYNTEEDRNEGKFIYKDNFAHSSWMSMIYDRIHMAKALQTDDGLLFSAIDDNESYSYKLLLDDIYGSDNFKANIIWHSRKSKQNDIDVSLSHNYIITYSKQKHKKELYGQLLNEAEFENSDNDPRGKWKVSPMDAPGIRERTSFFAIINPNTQKECLPPKGRHWTVFEEDVPQLIEEGRIYFGKNGSSRPQWKRYWSEVQEDSKTIGTIWDEVDTATNATKELENILGHKEFDTPKPSKLLEEIIQQSTAKDESIIDFFAGSGTTAHAVIKANCNDCGNRKYIIVEMGSYAETITKPRIQKVIYSKDWKDGKPVSREGSSHCFKTIRLESYEDCLNNLVLKRDAAADKALLEDDNLREQYLLSYMLDTEARDSVLNLAIFDKPFDYQLTINRQDETRRVTVDLVETFNYLIGLYVSHQDALRRFDCEFERDKEGKLVIKNRLKQSDSGRFAYRMLEGKTREGEHVLVIWREMTSNLEEDNVALDEFLRTQAIGTRELTFDAIYVNGDNNLPNIRKDEEHWKVQMIEEAFHRLMFSTEGV